MVGVRWDVYLFILILVVVTFVAIWRDYKIRKIYGDEDER